MWAATWQNQQSECASREDSDQPGHPPSLIRVFAVRMKKRWTLSFPLAHSEDSDQTGRMSRLIWVFAGRKLILLVLSCRGSCFLSIDPLVVTMCAHNKTRPKPDAIIFQTHEPPHDKSNKMARAPSEDSDQPGHPPNVLRVFIVRSTGS